MQYTSMNIIKPIKVFGFVFILQRETERAREIERQIDKQERDTHTQRHRDR